MHVDSADVLDLLRFFRTEADPRVRAGIYLAVVFLGLVAEDDALALAESRGSRGT